MCVCGGETIVCVCVCVRGGGRIVFQLSIARLRTKKKIDILYFVPTIIHREGVL